MCCVAAPPPHGPRPGRWGSVSEPAEPSTTGTHTIWGTMGPAGTSLKEPANPGIARALGNTPGHRMPEQYICGTGHVQPTPPAPRCTHTNAPSNRHNATSAHQSAGYPPTAVGYPPPPQTASWSPPKAPPPAVTPQTAHRPYSMSVKGVMGGLPGAVRTARVSPFTPAPSPRPCPTAARRSTRPTPRRCQTR